MIFDIEKCQKSAGDVKNVLCLVYGQDKIVKSRFQMSLNESRGADKMTKCCQLKPDVHVVAWRTEPMHVLVHVYCHGRYMYTDASRYHTT